ASARSGLPALEQAEVEATPKTPRTARRLESERRLEIIAPLLMHLDVGRRPSQAFRCPLPWFDLVEWRHRGRTSLELDSPSRPEAILVHHDHHLGPKRQVILVPERSCKCATRFDERALGRRPENPSILCFCMPGLIEHCTELRGDPPKVRLRRAKPNRSF